MSKILWIVATLVVASSLALGVHNASLYAPDHGFDGSGHVFYIQYMADHWKLPPPTAWETHQPPVYYIVGAVITAFFGTVHAAQYMNTFILWLLIGMVGLGLKKVLKDNIQVLLGMFSLAALPMLNIFPAMVTNELASTFWIISSGVASLYLVFAKNRKQVLFCSLWLGLSLVVGIWTKISIILILPTVGISYLIVFLRNKIKHSLVLVIGLSIIIVFGVIASPVFMRGAQSTNPSNVLMMLSYIKKAPTDLRFYYRLDWIPKVDMYNTQYYSLWGGAWNSFWTDGQNAITPFITFHKKSFILWTIGFILLPLSLYGLRSIRKKNKDATTVVYTIGITMIVMYVLYNMMANHYSAVRLTYQMGIVLPYAFGIAGVAANRKMKIIVFVLLMVQFTTLLSFYWIVPWWHVTK